MCSAAKCYQNRVDSQKLVKSSTIHCMRWNFQTKPNTISWNFLLLVRSLIFYWNESHKSQALHSKMKTTRLHMKVSNRCVQSVHIQCRCGIFSTKLSQSNWMNSCYLCVTNHSFRTGTFVSHVKYMSRLLAKFPQVSFPQNFSNFPWDFSEFSDWYCRACHCCC